MSGLQTERVCHVVAALWDVGAIFTGRTIERDDRAESRVECHEDGALMRRHDVESLPATRKRNTKFIDRRRTMLSDTRLRALFRDRIRSSYSVMRIIPIVLAVVMLSVALPVAGASTTTAPEHLESTIQLRATDVTADEALSTKDRAKRAYNRLTELDTREAIDVDSALLHSIKFHLKKGNLAFQTNEYEMAKKEYQIAIDQARTGVKNAYIEGSRTLLNGSAAYLTARTELGYTTPKMGMLTARIQKQQSELTNATSIMAARDRYQAAQALQSDVQALPAPWLIRIVSVATSLWILLPVVAILAGGSVWWYRRSESHDSSAGTDLH